MTVGEVLGMVVFWTVVFAVSRWAGERRRRKQWARWVRESASLPRGPAAMVVDLAIEHARQRLVGTQVAGFTVSTVFWYGPVDVDPVQLTIWVLLSGAPDEQIPVWYFGPLGDNGRMETSSGIGADAKLALETVRVGIRTDLGAAGFPRSEHVHVGFDSSNRVKEAGYAYFR